jgi:uncharacterized DUF497 family protein
VSYDLDIDEGNNGKCQSHGVSIRELYQMFAKSVSTFTIGRTADEERAIAIGTNDAGRHIYGVFTRRGDLIRPISVRYMHQKEIDRYVEKTR